MPPKHGISSDQLRFEVDSAVPVEATGDSSPEKPTRDFIDSGEFDELVKKIGSRRLAKRFLGLPLDDEEPALEDSGAEQSDQDDNAEEYPSIRLDERAELLLKAIRENELAEQFRGLRESGKRPGMSSNTEQNHAKKAREYFSEAYGLEQVQKVMDGPDSDLEEVTARHFANKFREEYAGPGRDREKARAGFRKILKRYIEPKEK